MKRKLLFLVVAIVIIITAFCGYLVLSNQSDDSGASMQSKEKIKYTAEEITNQLKGKGLNIGKVIVYTEETDLNNLLGRPGQYTSKTIFEDTRLEQIGSDDEPIGGTVEVFNNKADMEKRKTYIENISGGAAIFAQYIYGNNYALLRLENELTPTQAREYEMAFNEIMIQK